jgi:hypothetical protein
MKKTAKISEAFKFRFMFLVIRLLLLLVTRLLSEKQLQEAVEPITSALSFTNDCTQGIKELEEIKEKEKE